jgi:drug/metabolite transporter (DMT)-like permease
VKRWFGTVDVVMLLTVLFWAANFSIAKAVLSYIPPLAFNTIRLVGSSAIMLGLSLLQPARPISRSQIGRILFLGLTGHTAFQLFFILGLDATSASNSAIFMGMTPVTVAVVSMMAGAEKPSARTWLGICSSVFGVYLVITPADTTGSSTLGDLLILSATVCWAIYTVGSQPLLKSLGTLRVTTYTMTAGTVFFVPFGLPSLSKLSFSEVPWTAWAGTVYSFVFALSAAYFFWYYAVSRVGPTRTSVYSNLTPVAALLIAWLALGEHISLRQIIGTTIILTSIYLVRTSRMGPGNRP